MIFLREGDTLTVSGIEELATANASLFQSEMESALDSSASCVELELSQAGFVDCGGLGALIAAHKKARARNADVRFRLLNPSRQVRRLLKLMHLEDIYAVASQEPAGIGACGLESRSLAGSVPSLSLQV